MSISNINPFLIKNQNFNFQPGEVFYTNKIIINQDIKNLVARLSEEKKRSPFEFIAQTDWNSILNYLSIFSAEKNNSLIIAKINTLKSRINIVTLFLQCIHEEKKVRQKISSMNSRLFGPIAQSAKEDNEKNIPLKFFLHFIVSKEGPFQTKVKELLGMNNKSFYDKFFDPIKEVRKIRYEPYNSQQREESLVNEEEVLKQSLEKEENLLEDYFLDPETEEQSPFEKQSELFQNFLLEEDYFLAPETKEQSHFEQQSELFQKFFLEENYLSFGSNETNM